MMKIKKTGVSMKNKKKQSHGAVPGPAKRHNLVHPGTAATGVRTAMGTGSNEIFEHRAKSAVGRAFHVAATVDGRGPVAHSPVRLGQQCHDTLDSTACPSTEQSKTLKHAKRLIFVQSVEDGFALTSICKRRRSVRNRPGHALVQ